jgi:serine/threonine-protein kinase
MAVIRLQNETGDRNVYYEFDPSAAPLGEGGMGRVFRGVRIDRNGATRDVAIKVMFDDLPEHVIERARREASVRILNDNLLEMIDFVEVKERNSYGEVIATHYHVVSEFLNGVNIDDLLIGKTTNHDGQPNPTAERLYLEYQNNRSKFVGYVFRNILSGIMALHLAGYIHRDIDPSNIMVTSEGKIKLIDFGIARQVNTLGTQDKHLTSTGQFLGKPYYAAPELLLGDIAHQDATTDIYALGIMLFQLLAGHLPFDGPMHEVYDKQLKSNLPLKEISDSTVAKIIAKATQKKQEKRYQTAAEFMVDIDRWMMGLSKSSGSGNKVNFVKVGLIAASVAVIATAAVLLAGRFGSSDKAGSNNPQANSVVVENTVQQPKETQEEPQPQPPSQPQPEPEPEPIQEATPMPNQQLATNNIAQVESLLMDKSTAQEGIQMLNSLVDKGDYEATFLMSRLYFDPSVKDTAFYQEEWKTMRENSGISADNSKAHLLLLDALEKNDTDCEMLYQLGCDFMSGTARGCERDAHQAAWCFKQANNSLKDFGGSDADRYKSEIQNKMQRLGNTSPQRPVKP